jgi:transposase
MSNVSTYVGMDSHKKDIQVAMLIGTAREPVEWQVANEPGSIRRLLRKLEREAPGPIECGYEAGPCGYDLQRQMAASARVTCHVVAPALIPRKPGDRVKTNRRDARNLAELLRAGLLTMVRPPTPEDEAVRDLCRARDDAREDLLRARHRLSKLLLRQGRHYHGRSWTRAHRTWLDQLAWAHEEDGYVVEDYLLAIDHLETRLAAFDARLGDIAQRAPYRAPVGWLRCFRGIDTVSAMLVLAELHDFQRFPTARALMAYVGLVPSEHSTGPHVHRGPITKTGNALLRRIFVEAAWHYQHRAGVSRALRQRREGQPATVIAIADKAQHRLCRRFTRLRAEHKPSPKVVVAIARELTGFVWAALQTAPRTA